MLRKKKKEEEERYFIVRTTGVDPGSSLRSTTPSKRQLQKFRFFFTLNTGSLSLCNTMSPKPQNES